MTASRRLALAAMTGAALITAACATTRVGSFVERRADFRHYHSYAWAADPARTTGDPRLDNNPFFEGCLRTAVERQLASRGFEETPAGSAQLILHYHARISQEFEINGADEKYSYCEDCKPFVYDAGTIVLDLVDARTNQLAWRGWAEGGIDGLIDNQKWLDERIGTAVAQIIDRLPSRF